MKILLFIICTYWVHIGANNEILTLAEIQNYRLAYSGEGYLYSLPPECSKILDDFAEYASEFTLCSVQNARPVRICKRCISQYVKFKAKYGELIKTEVNGTSCKSVFISHDRLDVVLGYHDNILGIWNKGNCDSCYVWPNYEPILSNDTKQFNKMYNDTMNCIITNLSPTNNNSEEVCQQCMHSYLQLDEFYKSLSADTAVGIDTICMDTVDSMNATRSIWSKSLNCCKLRKTPEIIFLCSTAIISLLPVLFYLAVRYCGPIRDLHNVLRQSRFQQSILQSVDEGIN